MNFNLLNTLIDSLDLRICTLALPSAWLLSSFGSWRTYSEKSVGDFSQPDCIVALSDELSEFGYWSLKPFGHRPYEFILTNPEVCDIRIWNPEKWDKAITSQTGQIYISFRSKFLQHAGILGVQDLLNKITSLFFTSPDLLFCRVSRADLAADITCPGFSWSELGQFVSRSRYREASSSDTSLIEKALSLIDSKTSTSEPPQGITRGVVPTEDGVSSCATASGAAFSEHELFLLRNALGTLRDDGSGIYRVIHDRLPQTLYFGRFASPLYARIYNKLDSLRVQNKEYMRDIWSSAGWDRESSVWRFEFSLSGDFLKNVIDISITDDKGECLTDLRNFDSFLASIPQIWQYLTHKWLKYLHPKISDSNQWRHDIHPLWEVVQSAWDSEFLVFRKKLNHTYDETQMVAQIKGVALTIAARRSPKDEPTDETFSIILKDLWEYFDCSSFSEDLLERRRLLGIDTVSDTLYSAQIRSSFIVEGNGS